MTDKETNLTNLSELAAMPVHEQYEIISNRAKEKGFKGLSRSNLRKAMGEFLQETDDSPDKRNHLTRPEPR